MPESDIFAHLQALQDQVNAINNALQTLGAAVAKIDPEAGAELEGHLAGLTAMATDAEGAMAAVYDAAADGDGGAAEPVAYDSLESLVETTPLSIEGEAALLGMGADAAGAALVPPDAGVAIVP
jgi:hypothetical protein